ncbi:MAG: hypothetical protein KJ621_19220 [Proteobacteria bacterium]|nr:hypothetical protein [Pseudomonadota bacterium]MBU1740731.1 hypothetical protein [Pseudomonadota bacterium]
MLLPALAAAQYNGYRVRGYYRRNGTYVQPHFRTYPDGTRWNNCSTYPNVNPYTGQQGYRSPFPTVPTYRPYQYRYRYRR